MKSSFGSWVEDWEIIHIDTDDINANKYETRPAIKATLKSRKKKFHHNSLEFQC